MNNVLFQQLSLALIGLLCGLSLSVKSAFAQSSGQMATSTAMQTIVAPKKTGVLGNIDANAWTEVVNHRKAVGNYFWTGLQGTGSITYDSDQTTESATLTNFSNNQFRLDTQTSKGLVSVRINGFLGREQGVDGKTTTIPAGTAGVGIFPFEAPRTLIKSGPKFSLRDGGLVMVEGISLHLVTLEWATLGIRPATKQTETLAMNLYFDPGSHMLMKTAVATAVPHGRHAKFLFVVTYGDYRKVGEVMIPFRMSETMEGEPYRTLQLTDVKLNPAINDDFFQF